MGIRFRQIPVILCVISFLMSGQRERRSLGNPYFQALTAGYPTESADTVRLDVIVKVPYAAIQFLKKGGSFEAEYEVSVSVQDMEENQIGEQILQKKVKTDHYKQTISPTVFDLAKRSFALTPAEYKCIIELIDMDTHNSGRRTVNVDVSRFRDTVSVSDLYLADITSESDEFPGGIPILPPRIIDADSVLRIYYEARVHPGDYALIITAISVDDDTLKEKTDVRTATLSVVKEVIEFERVDAPKNKFKLYLTVEQGEASSQAELLVEVRWQGMTAHLSDLGEAIEQIRYIAVGKELRKIQRAKGEEREELFKEFWEAKDPSPGTPQNELMDEYYKRVQYSNEKFGTFRDGWRTAMGMIFILFGPPDDIEVNLFARDGRSYQTWRYYTINRTFVFVDYDGFGDYELLEPYHSPYGSSYR